MNCRPLDGVFFLLLFIVVLGREKNMFLPPQGCPPWSSGVKKFIKKKMFIINPDPIVLLPVPVDTSGRIHDDFSRLLFLHSHREASVLGDELPARNRINFVFFTLLVYLILSVQSG
jgi:hypothetical protein